MNKHGSFFFNDVWKARNDYINVIINETLESRIKFISDNTNRKLTSGETDISVKLLEMQKFAMFMFTSCGWFFSEISGLETVKILEYASRAIELAEEITGIGLEEEFLKKLHKANSNITNYVNGKNIYLKLVKHIQNIIGSPCLLKEGFYRNEKLYNYDYLLHTKTADKWSKIGVKRRAGVSVPLFSIYW